MQTAEEKLYFDAVAEFRAAFPNIQPPAPTWFVKWLSDYGSDAVSDAIQKLQRHPMKAQFTTESTGRALSTLLRQAAFRKAAIKAVQS